MLQFEVHWYLNRAGLAVWVVQAGAADVDSR